MNTAWVTPGNPNHHLVRDCTGWKRGRKRVEVQADVTVETPHGGFWCGVCAKPNARSLCAAPPSAAPEGGK